MSTMRTYDDGSHIDYTYSADGVKLRADYYQNPYTPAVPDGEFGIACDSSLLVHTGREYAGNRVYDNGVLSRLLFDGGETQTAISNNEGTRNDHYGNSYETESPITTHKKKKLSNNEN